MSRFDKYTDILYKGRYDHPIRITFLNGYQMVLTGEGGNSHLILRNETGDVDLWVDTHCAQGTAFIHSIRIEREPGARFMKYIMELLLKYSSDIKPSIHWYWMSFDRLDSFFETVYTDMKEDRISRF